MNEFPARLESEISSRKLFARGEKILVAVSGGADSTVLLHALNSIAKKNRWKIFVAHFNHQLRGRDSHADEKFVAQLAKKLRLKIFTERDSVKNFASQNKLSIEMAARKLRHEFFARIAQKEKIKKIALAHHADDQIELFFLRLFRGAGNEGLAGMKMISLSPADKPIEPSAKKSAADILSAEDAANLEFSSANYKSAALLQRPHILLVRPLLNFSKKEILEFARAQKISFRDDATNSSSDFLRNRIRNELLPLLKKNYQPAITKTILRFMEISRAESEFINQVTQKWFGKKKSGSASAPDAIFRALAENPRAKKTLELFESDERNCAGRAARPAASGADALPDFEFLNFDKLPIALQRKILQQQLLEIGVNADFELIEQLRQSPEQFVSVNSDFSVARDSSGKISQKRVLPMTQFQNEELRLKLTKKFFNHKETKKQSPRNFSTCDFAGRIFSWRIQSQKKFELSKKVAGETPAPLEMFDADKIGDEIILRHWRAGDFFHSIGFSSAIKLQDFFTNEKIPRVRRHELILATTLRGEIFWIEGLRISENFKLTRKTKRQLIWQWIKK